MTTGMPTEFDVAENDVKLCGVMITAESDTGRADRDRAAVPAGAGQCAASDGELISGCDAMA